MTAPLTSGRRAHGVRRLRKAGPEQTDSEPLAVTGQQGLARGVLEENVLQEEPTLITPSDLYSRGPGNHESHGIKRKKNQPSVVAERIFQ